MKKLLFILSVVPIAIFLFGLLCGVLAIIYSMVTSLLGLIIFSVIAWAIIGVFWLIKNEDYVSDIINI